MKKRTVMMAAALVGTLLMAGCAKTEEPAAAEAETTAVAETEAAAEAAETTAVGTETTAAEAEAEETAEEEMKEQAILVVSFGTSYNDSREKTIGAIEAAIGEAFPEYDVRRAFTAQTVIDILKERDGLEIPNMEEALVQAAADGVKTLIVQPTHLMNGFEYADLSALLEDYKGEFEKVALAEPLLVGETDFQAVADALVAETSSYDNGETAVCYMGHGTEAESNAVYQTLQDNLTEGGYENYYIGTVEAEPSLETLMQAITEKGSYKKVVLKPLMVVAGDHASNDMAGDEEDSWKSRFAEAGFEVECILQGLGENADIRAIYTAHTQAAIDSLE